MILGMVGLVLAVRGMPGSPPKQASSLMAAGLESLHHEKKNGGSRNRIESVGRNKMKKSLVVAAMLIAAAGWSQVTTIEFVAQDGSPFPVFEVVGQTAPTGAFFQPAFMAPVGVEVANGWHRYQIGQSEMFSKTFDVVADGTAQSWLLNGGNQTLSATGFVTYLVGVGVLTVGFFALIGPGLNVSQTHGIILTVGGAAVTVGGLVLNFAMKPTVRRVR